MSGSSKKVIYAALIGNALLACTKFVASALTGSSATLPEGIRSRVDAGNPVLLLHGMRQSRKPPDARIPFGHGNDVLTLHMGLVFNPVTISVDLSDQVSAGEIERVTAGLDCETRANYPDVKRVFVEATRRDETQAV